MTCAVFVNTCDSFQDCWPPFFTLLSLYGGELRRLPIHLNTERANFQWDGLNITSTAVWRPQQSARPSWSECLLRALDSIEQDHVLYLQEDYFLRQPVRDDLIDEALSLMTSTPEAGVVYLTRNGPRIVRSLQHSPHFSEIQPPARYLINTQPAIWNKHFLLSLVRDWENAWMFEKFGTLRARSNRRRIFSLSSSVLAAGDAIDHVYSGVIKGQWKRECVELFNRHGIAIDFDRRGFYEEGPLLKYRLEVVRKLYGRPIPALRSLCSVALRT